MENKNVKVDLPSKIYLPLSESVYDECYCNFSESQWFSFNNFINAGSYFPQILQFVVVLVSILNGKTLWHEIILCNLIAGCGFTLLWYLFKLYQVPGLSYICCFVGGNIFRLFIHFIPLGIISFFILKDWKILLFCILGGIIKNITWVFLYGMLASTKYNDTVAIYVSKFKIK